MRNIFKDWQAGVKFLLKLFFDGFAISNFFCVSGDDCRHSAMEDFYIGGASVKLFLPIFKMNFPEIVDLALPPACAWPHADRAEGVFHYLVFVRIKKTYPMQAYKVLADGHQRP